MNKFHSKEAETGHINREVEILRKNDKKNARDKNIVTEMRNAFDRLISRLDRAEG